MRITSVSTISMASFSAAALPPFPLVRWKGRMRPGCFSTKPIDDFARAVGGAVVDWDDEHFVLRIIDAHQRGQNVGDDLFFVVCGHENRDLRPIGGVSVNVGMPLKSKEAIQREQVMACRVDGDDEDDGDRGSRPWYATGGLRTNLFGVAPRPRPPWIVGFAASHACGFGGSLNSFSGSRSGVFPWCQRVMASTILSAALPSP